MNSVTLPITLALISPKTAGYVLTLLSVCVFLYMARQQRLSHRQNLKRVWSSDENVSRRSRRIIIVRYSFFITVALLAQVVFSWWFRDYEIWSRDPHSFAAHYGHAERHYLPSSTTGVLPGFCLIIAAVAIAVWQWFEWRWRRELVSLYPGDRMALPRAHTEILVTGIPAAIIICVQISAFIFFARP